MKVIRSIFGVFGELLAHLFKSIFGGLVKLLRQPVFLLILLIVVSGAGVYLYMQNQSISTQLAESAGIPNQNTLSDDEVAELVKTVGELTELPEGEIPTIATVTNFDAVKDQPFFTNSENGDKVLIYTGALRAILYRPGSHKIIEIAPLNLGGDSVSPGTDLEPKATDEGDGNTAEVVEPLRLAIYDSSPREGMTIVASDEIAVDLPSLEFNVVAREPSAGNYDDTLVVVMNEEFRDVADDIADALGVSVGDFPSGEITPVADVLVILGNNFRN